MAAEGPNNATEKVMNDQEGRVERTANTLKHFRMKEDYKGKGTSSLRFQSGGSHSSTSALWCPTETSLHTQLQVGTG